MDATVIIVIALFACIIIAAFFVFRQRARVDIKGPFGTGLKLDVSNELPLSAPGVKAKDVTSVEGKIDIEDKTGRGADAEGIRAKQDVNISSGETSYDPKA